MDAMKKYGLLAGLAFIAWQYFEFYSGIHNTDFAAFSGFLPVPIFIVCLFMAIRDRRAQMGGYMEFTDGLRTGLGASAIAAIVLSIGQYIYARWVNPAWVLTEAENFRQYLIKDKIPAAEIQTQVADFIATRPFRSSVEVLASMIFMGAIITIILSATMRKKQPTHTV